MTDEQRHNLTVSQLAVKLNEAAKTMGYGVISSDTLDEVVKCYKHFYKPPEKPGEVDNKHAIRVPQETDNQFLVRMGVKKAERGHLRVIK